MVGYPHRLIRQHNYIYVFEARARTNVFDRIASHHKKLACNSMGSWRAIQITRVATIVLASSRLFLLCSAANNQGAPEAAIGKCQMFSRASVSTEPAPKTDKFTCA